MVAALSGQPHDLHLRYRHPAHPLHPGLRRLVIGGPPADPPGAPHHQKVWKELLVSLAALALLVWLAFFIISGSLTVPLLRTGFRMVVFSVIIMIVVLFFRRGIMGDKEFSDILFARRKASGKGAVK